MPIAALESRKTLALAVARLLYGSAPTAAVRLRDEGSFVFRVEFGGLPAKVVKLPGRTSRILREQRIIRALRRGRWRMPAPAIEFTQEDLPASCDGPRAVTVMSLCPGMTLADAILRGETWAGEAMREAGAIAARLADAPLTILGRAPRGQPESEAARAWRWIEPVIEQFALGRLLPFLRLITEGERPARVLAHGAFFAENLLCAPNPGGTRLWVLDWEAAQPGSPLVDLASLIASLAELSQSDSGQRAYLRRRAIDGYSALRPLDEEETRELRAREAIRLLSIARCHLEAQRRDKAGSLATMAADCATA